MTTQEIVIAVAGFLGGGLIATVISILAQYWSTKRAAERAYLGDALRYVYGPVFHLLIESRDLMSLAKDVRDVASEHFGNKKWAESAQEQVERDMDATFNIRDKYRETISQNIDEAIKICNDNWHLIELADSDVFYDMQRQRRRWRIEWQTEDGPPMPFAVKRKLDPISFYKEEWTVRIEDRYNCLIRRYRKLTGI